MRLHRMFALALAVAVTGCADEGARRGPAGTAVIASVAEPSSLVPPLIYDGASRDLADLVYERLATLVPGGASIDSSAYQPGLADRWERIDSLSWRFHLRPDARWHDGAPVTAADVVFSFQLYADSVIDALARDQVAGRITAHAEDSATVRLSFARNRPEQLYDATQHVRILPRHVWQSMGSEALLADTALSHLVGSGPYRVAAWRHGESLELRADTLRPADGRAGLERVVVRFTGDPGAAVNLLLSHEADLMETLVSSQDADRVAQDSTFRLDQHGSVVYGFLAFKVADDRGRPHPTLGQRDVRRALAMAVDRQAVATNAFGPGVKVPAGPVSAMSWIGSDGIEQLGLDTAAAALVLRGRGVKFDILVPGTSPSRVQIAQALQEMWRRAGAEVTVTRVDFPVFQERLAAGRFDSYIGAYLDEPTLRGLEEQWGTAGWDQVNYGRWSLPAFDSLLTRAAASSDTSVAGPLYRQALSLLNQDAPAIFLYNPVARSAISRRLDNVTINPYAWLATLPDWTVQ